MSARERLALAGLAGTFREMGAPARAELCYAAARGGIALTFAVPDVPWSENAPPPGTPALVLIGERVTPLGPAGWQSAREAFEWARVVLVQPGAPTAEHYRAITQYAAGWRRVVLVETDDAHAEQWTVAAEAAGTYVWCFMTGAGAGR